VLSNHIFEFYEYKIILFVLIFLTLLFCVLGMTTFQDKTRNACGYGPVAFVASVQSLQSLPQDLTSSGHFLFVLFFGLLVSH
jgi:hypothetical protein